MLELNCSPFPVLTTSRLTLRRVRPGDINEIFFLRSDERVLTYLGKAPAASQDEALDFIHTINQLEDNNDAVTWGLTLHHQDLLVGTICYWNITKQHYRAELGYALHPALQGKGYMQEALLQVLAYGFGVMKLHSVEARVDPHNQPSIQLLERNHFTREGFFKEDYFYDGKFLDTAVYSLLASQHTIEL